MTLDGKSNPLKEIKITQKGNYVDNCKRQYNYCFNKFIRKLYETIIIKLYFVDYKTPSDSSK